MIIAPSPLRTVLALLLSVTLVVESIPAAALTSNVWNDRPASITLSRKSTGTPLSEPAIPAWISSAVAGQARLSTAAKAAPAKFTVLLVHDLHLDADAQESISAVIERIADAEPQGRLAVGLEASGADHIDLALFSHPTHREPAQRIIAALRRANVLTGAESAAINDAMNDTTRIMLFGVDSPVAYMRNVQSLRDGQARLPIVNAELDQFDLALDQARSKLTPSIHALAQAAHDYHSGRLTFPAYVQLLRDKSGGALTGPQLNHVLEAADIEPTLNRDLIEQERQECIRKKSSPAKYAHLRQYLHYLDVMEHIDIDQALAELPDAEATARRALHANTSDIEIWDLDEDALLIRRLVQHALTEQEWDRTQQRWALLEKLPERISAVAPAIRSSAWDDGHILKPYADFYTWAAKRDHEMAARFLNRLSVDDVHTGVLVAGGFHARGVKKILTAAGARVIDITPALTETQLNSPGPSSLDYLTSGRRPIDALMVGERLFLNLPPITAGDKKQDVAKIVRAGSKALEVGEGTEDDVTVKTVTPPTLVPGLRLDVPAGGAAPAAVLMASKKTYARWRKRLAMANIIALLPLMMGQTPSNVTSVGIVIMALALLSGAYFIGARPLERTVPTRWQPIRKPRRAPSDEPPIILPFPSKVPEPTAPWKNLIQQRFFENGPYLKDFADINQEVSNFRKGPWLDIRLDPASEKNFAVEIYSEAKLYAWLAVIATTVAVDRELAQFLIDHLSISADTFADLSLDKNKNLVRSPEQRKEWFATLQMDAQQLLFARMPFHFRQPVPTRSNRDGMSDDFRVALYALAQHTTWSWNALNKLSPTEQTFVKNALDRWRISTKDGDLTITEVIDVTRLQSKLRADKNKLLSRAESDRALLKAVPPKKRAELLEEILAKVGRNVGAVLSEKMSDATPAFCNILVDHVVKRVLRPYLTALSPQEDQQEIEALARSAIHAEIRPPIYPPLSERFDRVVFNYDRSVLADDNVAADRTLRSAITSAEQAGIPFLKDAATMDAVEAAAGKRPVLWIFDEQTSFFDLTAHAARLAALPGTHTLYSLQITDDFRKGWTAYKKFLVDNKVTGPARVYAELMKKNLDGGRLRLVTADHFDAPVENADRTWSVDPALLRTYEKDFRRQTKTEPGRIALVSNYRWLSAPGSVGQTVVDVLLSVNLFISVSGRLQASRWAARRIGTQA